MFPLLGQFVARHWQWVIAAWLVLVVVVHWTAPHWDDVTRDGDLAFLPTHMPSVQGDQLTKQAFPATRAKSEVLLVVARDDRRLEPDELLLADQLAARFFNRWGANELVRGRTMLESPAEASQANDVFQVALAAFDEAIKLDEQFAPAWHNRAMVYQQLGRTAEMTASRDIALQLAPGLDLLPNTLMPQNATDLPVVEVWTRHHEVFGSKLKSEAGKAVIIIVRLSNEFMATENIGVLRLVENELQQFRETVGSEGAGLEFGISGTAAIGGDMLSAAAESIRNTEWLTVILVVAILLVVYRAPLLVVVPLVTIGVSLSISTGLLASLTQLDQVPGFSWWGFKVFKTTRIFIIAILYGSGTDFCLFLLARVREEIPAANNVVTAVGTALGRVGGALLASAMTTILGLGMMFFAEFGKFRNSGPAIGLCLFVTLAACLTLAPALVCALGRAVFWPFSIPTNVAAVEQHDTPGLRGWLARLWELIADFLVRFPTPILTVCVLLLAPLAIAGIFTADHVTFDFLSELPAYRITNRGNNLLQQHFPVGEGGPVVVLARRPGAGFDSVDPETAARGMAEIYKLTEKLSKVDGVKSVRSLAEPLGDSPTSISFISSAGRRKLFLRAHQLTKSLFLAQSPPYRGEITRFEVVLKENPFSLAALETLSRIDKTLVEASDLPNSFWHGGQFAYTGATAGIRDLRSVTRSDNWRIQILVTIAVWGVLMLILRRPGISIYLIASVLFSYFVTIGATELSFGLIYGDSFQGLDWKVPLFLFVILVAVGEDYNIYLVTRVLEEQAKSGPFSGLREGILRTGGIITSCGVIMAGSFVSMVTGSLRGISELGFALTLGILIDTFIVRTLLVSAFLSLVARWQVGRSRAPAEAQNRTAE